MYRLGSPDGAAFLFAKKDNTCLQKKNIDNILHLANILPVINHRIRQQVHNTNFTYSGLVKFNCQTLWTAEVQVSLHG